MKRQGIPMSPGIAIGPLYMVQPNFDIPQRTETFEPVVEQQRLNDAIVASRLDLETIRDHAVSQQNETVRDIMDVHIAMLQDPLMLEQAKATISDQNTSAEDAFHQSIESFLTPLEDIQDPVFQDRILDIKDVEKRVFSHLSGIMLTKRLDFHEEGIYYFEELVPSEIAQLSNQTVLGIVSPATNVTSHAVILSRSLGIPMVLGVTIDSVSFDQHPTIIVDGYAGTITIDPSKSALEASQQQAKAQDTRMHQFRHMETTTKDGRKVPIAANIASLEELALAIEYGAEGIGLFRTESLYTDRDDLPTEAEQFEVYRTVLASFPNHRVIIRLFDLGGDKPIASIPTKTEQNPFLGIRGIRFALRHQTLLETQLRALVRASEHHQVHILIPMITSIDELRMVQALLDQSETELRDSGVIEASHVQLGVMIETPAAAILADQFAKEVDFFSIGTNDLTQYTLAMSRINKDLSDLYQPYHPAILRLIERVVMDAKQQGIWVSVCGEMASHPIGSALLLGLGVDELSMSPIHIISIREKMAILDYVNMIEKAIKCTQMKTNDEIIEYMQDLIKRR